MSAYSEEQRIFINDMKLENKTIKEIQTAFSEKFNRVPAPVTISKYGNYHKWGRGTSPDSDVETPTPKVEPKDEEIKEGGDVLEVEVKKTVKKKKDAIGDGLIHFSDGEINEEDFNKIVAARGTTQAETWDFLRKCGEKGYTKINLVTGEVLK